MPSRRLLTLSLALTAISGYLVFFTEADALAYYILLGVGICGAMMTYVFQHQINLGWYRRYPPRFPEEIEKLYLRSAPFYVGLNPELRKAFQTRVALFIESKEFIAQGFNEVAEEIKYLIAYYAIALSFREDQYTFSPYNRIVLYLHPFLSPNMPDTVHAYEAEHTDGTIIFSLEQLTAGFLNPQKYYQIGFHVFAELYARQTNIPEVEDETWEVVTLCSGWSKKDIEDFTGMPQQSVVPAAIHLWFSHGKTLREQAPALYDQISGWLKHA